MIPGVVAAHAAQIDVPVLIGYGAVDVSPEPRGEARLYRNSPDITTIVLAGSAHCHNMASSRHQLWGRLLTWVETVTNPTDRASIPTLWDISRSRQGERVPIIRAER